MIYKIYYFLKTNATWHSAHELAQRFDTDARTIRKLVSEINRSFGSATFDYVILSSNRGYKVAETKQEALKHLERLYKPALMMLDRYHKCVKKLELDQQQKLKLSPYAKTEYNALKSNEDVAEWWERRKMRGEA